MKKIFLIPFIISLLCACSTHLADLTMVSNKNITLKKVNLDRAPQKHNVIGESSKFVFLFIPFGAPTLKEAVDDALQKGNGDLITDASVYSKGWWFLVGQVGLEVRGTVVDTKGVKQ